MIIDTEKWCCKNCKHRPYVNEFGDVWGPRMIKYREWTEDSYEGQDVTCPYICEDDVYNSEYPEDTDFCARFEASDNQGGSVI